MVSPSEPVKLAAVTAPLPTLISADVKPVTASPNPTANGIGDVGVGPVAVDVIVADGAVPS